MTKDEVQHSRWTFYEVARIYLTNLFPSTINKGQMMRGGAAWKLVGLITRRSLVRIQPPLPNKIRHLENFLSAFFTSMGSGTYWLFSSFFPDLQESTWRKTCLVWSFFNESSHFGHLQIGIRILALSIWFMNLCEDTLHSLVSQSCISALASSSWESFQNAGKTSRQ